MNQKLKELRESIIKYKYKVIAAIFGVFLSTLSIIIYTQFKQIIWIHIILVFICLSFAVFQTYNLYLKNKDFDTASKIILSLLFFLIYLIIVFTAIIIVSLSLLKLSYNSDYLIYAILSAPAFVFVIILFLIILSSIGYV